MDLEVLMQAKNDSINDLMELGASGREVNKVEGPIKIFFN